MHAAQEARLRERGDETGLWVCDLPSAKQGQRDNDRLERLIPPRCPLSDIGLHRVNGLSVAGKLWETIAAHSAGGLTTTALGQVVSVRPTTATAGSGGVLSLAWPASSYEARTFSADGGTEKNAQPPDLVPTLAAPSPRAGPSRLRSGASRVPAWGWAAGAAGAGVVP